MPTSRPVVRRALLGAVALLAPLAPAVAAQTAAMPPRRRTSPSATRTPRAPEPADYISDGTSCQRSTSAYPSLIAAARGYSLNFRACSGARVADVTNTQLSALTASTSYVTHLRRRQRRRVRRRAHRVRDSVVGRRLRRRDRPGAGVHQQHLARPAVDALRLDPDQGAERQGGRRRLPADLHGRGLQRRHLVLAGGDDPAQPDGRPAQQQDLGPGLGQGLLVRATRPAASSGTPSATTRSGSTGCPTRSARATTRTSPATPPATRRPSARCSPAPR